MWAGRPDAWSCRPDEDIWRSENLTKFNVTGFETGIAFALAQAALSVQYTYLHSGKQSGEFLSNYALDHLAHKIDLTLGLPLHLPLPLLRHGGFRTNLTWQDRSGGYLRYEDNAFAGIRSFEPFWMADTRIFFDNGPTRVFAEASNLWNTRYVDIGNVPQPGRWVRAGMEIRF